ncbi:hypothetical protein [Flavobacterium sp.]|uniref:hypothetical protein n=1 Tax=Flavobacterium sp. TaxID=239 RepID=UPI0037C05D78
MQKKIEKMKKLFARLCFILGIYKIEKEDFFLKLKDLTLDCSSCIAKANKVEEETFNKSVFEINLLLFVICSRILKEKFKEKQYDEIINFYTNQIIVNSTIHKLIGNNNIKAFYEERFLFHQEGLIKLKNRPKYYTPVPKDYTQSLYSVFFERPLEKIDEIYLYFDIFDMDSHMKNEICINAMFKFFVDDYIDKIQTLLILTKKW